MSNNKRLSKHNFTHTIVRIYFVQSSADEYKYTSKLYVTINTHRRIDEMTHRTLKARDHYTCYRENIINERKKVPIMYVNSRIVAKRSCMRSNRGNMYRYHTGLISSVVALNLYCPALPFGQRTCIRKHIRT